MNVYLLKKKTQKIIPAHIKKREETMQNRSQIGPKSFKIN